VRLSCLLLCALLGLRTAPVYAETAVGGAIGSDTLWTVAAGPYIVTSAVDIDGNATLTVEAGVVVRFQAGLGLTVRNGALKVAGTATSPVLFTSWRNIPGGTPTAGDWTGIRFLENTDDASTIIDHLTISYGSTTSLAGASPTFNDCRFEGNSGYALAIDLASFPHGSGNSAQGNTVDAIKVPAGEITGAGTWDLTSIPYFLEGEVSVGAAPRLVGIEPAEGERNSTFAAEITGSRLTGARTVTFSDQGIVAAIQPGGTDTAIPVQLTIDSGVPFGSFDLSVTMAAGMAALNGGFTVLPPLPRLVEVTPDRQFVDAPATTVSLAGQNFTSETTAYLNGTSLATVFVNSALLTATVPTQSLPAAGQLMVRNPDPRAEEAFLDSNAISFTIETPRFIFSPDSLTLRQGATEANLDLIIPFTAPAGGLTATLTVSDYSIVTIPNSTAVIAEGESSVSIPLTPLDTGQSSDQVVEIQATRTNWTSGKAMVTVKPKPTIHLSPTATLTGLGYTYFLTVTPSDTAPAGGLTVDLFSSPAGVVTCPPTVHISEGSSSAQVSVVASGLGTATITPSAPGLAFTGNTNTVTVMPVRTIGIGPIASSPVGIAVTRSAPPSPSTTFGMLTSKTVGVAVGAVVTGLAPDRAAIGTSDLTLRINGSGLDNVSAVSFVPPDGITVQAASLRADPGGGYVEVSLSVDQNAPISERTVIVSTDTGSVAPSSPGANIFRVTHPAPQLWSLLPNNGVIGTTFSFQVNGRHLQQASEIKFIPDEGISIGNPPTVSGNGTLATVNLSISPEASTGVRGVAINTPGGETPLELSAANSFAVLAEAGDTYTPVRSAVIGVTVETTPPAAPSSTYAAVGSRPVGVVVGSVITAVSPESGIIGTEGIVVRVLGNGLATVTGMTFVPEAGIAIRPETFSAAADGTYCEATLDIAADAPLTTRTIVLNGVAAYPASPGVNLFRVTRPQPLIHGIAPIRKEAGAAFTLSMHGVNLAAASRIDFSPAEGIVVANPPSINGDGTLATVSVVIDPAGPVGDRIVTVTTPGGTSSDTPSAANTFTVTTEAGATYSPLLSRPIGVLVSYPPPAPERNYTYGPVRSLEVGVLVESPAPSDTRNVSYNPVLSRPVGVAVGAVVTAMTPAAIEPGATAELTIHGAGLDRIDSVLIQPAAGFTIGTPHPAADGLSLTVDITADASVPTGAKSVIASTASGGIPVATAGANTLLTGPKPAINSIEPIQEVAAAKTFVLTIHGSNLQGATAVRFTPADGIEVSSTPAYYADGLGEHVSVTVFISSGASGGERVVEVFTPYGSTGSEARAANTFTVATLTSAITVPPRQGEQAAVTCRAGSPALPWREGSRLDALMAMPAAVVPLPGHEGRGEAVMDEALLSRCAGETICRPGASAVAERNSMHRSTAYRGPPGKNPLAPRG